MRDKTTQRPSLSVAVCLYLLALHSLSLPKMSPILQNVFTGSQCKDWTWGLMRFTWLVIYSLETLKKLSYNKGNKSEYI